MNSSRLELLPNELILKILSLLPNLADRARLESASKRLQEILQQSYVQFSQVKFIANGGWLTPHMLEGNFPVFANCGHFCTVQLENAKNGFVSYVSVDSDKRLVAVAEFIVRRCGRNLSAIHMELLDKTRSKFYPSAEAGYPFCYKFFQSLFTEFESCAKIRKLKLINTFCQYDFLAEKLGATLEDLEIFMPLDTPQDHVDLLSAALPQFQNLRNFRFKLSPTRSFEDETLLVRAGVARQYLREDICHCLYLWEGLQKLRKLEFLEIFVSAVVDAQVLLNVLQKNPITSLNLSLSLLSFRSIQEAILIEKNIPILAKLENLTVHFLVADLAKILQYCVGLKCLRLATENVVPVNRFNASRLLVNIRQSLGTWLTETEKRHLSPCLTVQFPKFKFMPDSQAIAQAFAGSYELAFLQQMERIKEDLRRSGCVVEVVTGEECSVDENSEKKERENTCTINKDDSQLRLVWTECFS